MEGEGGLKLNVTMTLWFPEIVWTSPLIDFVIKGCTYKMDANLSTVGVTEKCPLCTMPCMPEMQ